MKPREITICNNYDVDSYREDAIETLAENGNESPSEDEIWNECAELSQQDMEDVFDEMNKFFNDGRAYFAFGTITRWTGTHEGFVCFTSFEDLLATVGADCDNFRFTEIGGHFYMKCSHHDGTNFVEVKVLTDAGRNLYENEQYEETMSNSELRTALINDVNSEPLNYIDTLAARN